MRSLSEQETNRALNILTDENLSVAEKRRDLETDFSRGSSVLADAPAYRQRIIRELMENNETKTKLREWLQRHGMDGLKETEGAIVKKPGLLRVNEQKHLTKPNLRHIFSEHFDRIGYSHDQRTLVDIGTWDGEIPRSLQPIFGRTIGIEMNENKFDELVIDPRNARLIPVRGDIVDIMKNAALSAEVRGDAYLMSHLLYFLSNAESGEDYDAVLLKWVMRQLSPKGIGVIVLNDTRHDSPFNSRDGVRKHFGIRETNPSIDHYAAMLHREGITTRIIRPSLRITGHTPDGKRAMKDVIRFLIPGDARNNDRKLDEYVQTLEEECNAEFLHTLSMLVMYKDPATAPAESAQPIYPVTKDTSRLFHRTRSISTPVRTAVANVVSPVIQPESLPTAPEPECMINFEDFRGKLQELTTAEMINLLEEISKRTDGGDEDKLKLVLDELGMQRTTFFKLLENKSKLQKSAREHPTVTALSIINGRSASTASSGTSTRPVHIRRHPSRSMERRMAESPVVSNTIVNPKDNPVRQIPEERIPTPVLHHPKTPEHVAPPTESSLRALVEGRSELIKTLLSITDHLRTMRTRD
jgi:hypothetical protein